MRQISDSDYDRAVRLLTTFISGKATDETRRVAKLLVRKLDRRKEGNKV